METHTNSPKKSIFSSLSKFLFPVVLITAIFFAFYRILDIPPGIQYDQLRAVLVPELLTKGFISTLSARQLIAGFLLGGFWSHFLAELFRINLSIPEIILASRIPPAIFFILSTIVWWKILEQLKLSDWRKFIFFLIFIPSPLFIVFSHYIPLVAGYLFFSSLSILFLLKFINSTELGLKWIMFSILSAILSTYTHGMSVFFAPIFYMVTFVLLVVSHRKVLAAKIKQYKADIKINIAKTALGLLFCLTAFYPFISGYTGTDQSLQLRNTFSVAYLLSMGEYKTALDNAVNRVFYYVHPNNLVTGVDFIPGQQPPSSQDWYDIRNPRYNQWLVTGAGPFGFISVLVYLGAFLIIKKTFSDKSLPHLLALALLITYILLPVFPNFDNPSFAKTLPALMFIPLVCALVIGDISNGLKSKNSQIFFKLLLSIVVLLNAVFNFSYIYSNSYQANEVYKFAYKYEDAVSYIKNNADLDRLRIGFHDPFWNNFTMIEYFYGPDIMNRIFWINETAALKPGVFDKNEDNIILTRYPEDIEAIAVLGIPYKVIEYKTPADTTELYLIHIFPKEKPDDSSAAADKVEYTLLKSQDLLCANNAFSPEYKGEFELVKSLYRYFPKNSLDYIDDCSGIENLSLNLINPNRVTLNDNKLTSDVPTQNLKNFELNEIEARTYILTDLPSVVELDLNGSEISLGLRDVREITEKVEFSNNPSVTKEGSAWKFKSSYDPGVLAFVLPEADLPGTFYTEFEFTHPINGDADISFIDAESRKVLPTVSLRDFDLQKNNKYRGLVAVDEPSRIVGSIVLVNNLPIVDRNKHVAAMKVGSIKIVKVANENLVDYKLKNFEIETVRAGRRTKKAQIISFINLPVGAILPPITKGEYVKLQMPYSDYYSFFDSNRDQSRSLKPVKFNGWLQGVRATESAEQIFMINGAVVYLLVLTLIYLVLIALLLLII